MTRRAATSKAESKFIGTRTVKVADWAISCRVTRKTAALQQTGSFGSVFLVLLLTLATLLLLFLFTPKFIDLYSNCLP